MSAAKIYRIILRKEPDGNYAAIVPALYGCISRGENIEQALGMAKKAIIGYIQVLEEEAEAVPDDNETLEYSLRLHL
jgi:antitoxin HicB